jgi:TolA-binding protein
MKRALVLTLLFAGTLFGQTIVVPQRTQHYTTKPPLEPIPPGDDDEKDPAYKTYKEGYALILGDKWSEAMKKFGEVKSKFPQSDYLDDAAYWSAYAQKRLDYRKGIAAYELFLESYPESRYADDAVADMDEHNVSVVVSGDAKNVRVRTPRPGSYSYSYGTTARASEQAMRDAERAMRQGERELRRSVIGLGVARAPRAWNLENDGSERKLDAKTRLKVSALQALGDNHDDKEAFQTLKEIALDKAQSVVLRRTAVETLEDFDKFDAVTVLLDVARSDPDEYVRIAAINGLGEASRDKNKAVENLILLWSGTPKGLEKQFETLLYVIADVGNDKAVDFLVKVAQSNESDDLRNDAVLYLGSIGSPKSRAALIQILKSK